MYILYKVSLLYKDFKITVLQNDKLRKLQKSHFLFFSQTNYTSKYIKISLVYIFIVI